MEPIRRPSNVIVPRSLDRRIEARRVLASQDATVEDMRTTLRHLGAKVPGHATKEALRADLERLAMGDNLLAEPAARGQASAAPTATAGGE